MKIGILTYHLSHNYGAFLQAYALVMRLRKDFPEDKIELINYNMCVAERYYKKVIFTENRFRTIPYNLKRYKTFESFKEMLPVGNIELHSNSMNEFEKVYANKYDIIIAGSDEIWRLTGSRGFPNPYWLPGKLGCKKMSYAASSRSNFNCLDNKNKAILSELLNDFCYIGVRDQSTYESVCSVVTNPRNVHYNCDPTLIYDFEYSKTTGAMILEKKFHIDRNKKTIGVMLTNDRALTQLQKTLGDNYNYVSLFQKHLGTLCCATISPFEWIDVISSLDFLVSSFFHGVCFAINTGVPFAALEKNAINHIKRLYN